MTKNKVSRCEMKTEAPRVYPDFSQLDPSGKSVPLSNVAFKFLLETHTNQALTSPVSYSIIRTLFTESWCQHWLLLFQQHHESRFLTSYQLVFIQEFRWKVCRSSPQHRKHGTDRLLHRTYFKDSRTKETHKWSYREQKNRISRQISPSLSSLSPAA